MCYAAQIEADYRRYVRVFGASISLDEFYELFWRRTTDKKIRIPKAVEESIRQSGATEFDRIHDLIKQYHDEQEQRLEQELFKQRKRLADAQRKLQVKVTKAAQDDVRIASDKVPQIMRWLADLNRSELTESDSRVYPLNYAPVLVARGSERVVMPMRYQCRVAGTPAKWDEDYPGTYNAMGALLTVRTAWILQYQ